MGGGDSVGEGSTSVAQFVVQVKAYRHFACATTILIDTHRLAPAGSTIGITGEGIVSGQLTCIVGRQLVIGILYTHRLTGVNFLHPGDHFEADRLPLVYGFGDQHLVCS